LKFIIFHWNYLGAEARAHLRLKMQFGWAVERDRACNCRSLVSVYLFLFDALISFDFTKCILYWTFFDLATSKFYHFVTTLTSQFQLLFCCVD